MKRLKNIKVGPDNFIKLRAISIFSEKIKLALINNPREKIIINPPI